MNSRQNLKYNSIDELFCSSELVNYQQYLEDMVDKRTAELQEANALLQLEIAQHHATESELQARNRQLELIMNTPQNPIYMKDASHRFLHINEAFLEFFGLTSDEVIGHTIEDFCQPDYRSMHQKLDQQISNRPESYRNQATIFTKDGMMRDVLFNRSAIIDDHGHYAGLVGVITDITDKIATEKQLTHSRAWFDHCFNNHLYGICITQFDTGAFVDLNDTLLKQLGYSKQELIGNPIKDFGIWPNYNEREQLLNEVAANGFVINKEITFCSAKGQTIPFLVSAQKFEFDNELYLFTVLNNVSVYMQTAKDLARLDRLNIVGEMAASISHEIRNPMTAVKGMLQLVREEYPHHRENDIFDLLIDEMDRANSIITEFLSLAPDKSSSPRLMNLNDIIRAIYPLLNAEALAQDKYVRLQLETLPELWLDESEIRQLVINLVKNSLEACPAKAIVTIATELFDKCVTLAVIDHGSGIASDVLENIWKPFVTTKANGTGLGLSVCYTIASRHHATINVDTGTAGTTFKVSFPAEV